MNQIKTALVNLNEQINQLADKRYSIVNLISMSERDAQLLKEDVKRLDKTLTYKTPRGVKTALTKLNNKKKERLDKRESIDNLILKIGLDARHLNEHIKSLKAMLLDVDIQMPRMLEQHEQLKIDYLKSICSTTME